MAIPKAERSPEEIEHILLGRVLRITLSDEQEQGRVYLEQIAAELLSEDKPLMLSRDVLDRVFTARLQMVMDGLEEPFDYLIGCYHRTLEEGRKTQNVKDKKKMEYMQDTINHAKDMIVLYSGIIITHPDVFPQTPSKSLLLDLLLRDGSSGSGNGNAGPTLPSGYIESLITKFEGDELDAILHGVFTGLRDKTNTLTLFSPFQKLLGLLNGLLTESQSAKSFVRHPNFIPRGDHINGRVMEITSLLGPFFRLGSIPDLDVFSGNEPNVGRQCFSDAANRRKAEIQSSCTTIMQLTHQLHGGLNEVIVKLLRHGKETREPTMEFIGEFIKKNAGRGQMQVNLMTSASSSSFVNLSAVMLKLCEPFLNNHSKSDKLDLSYVVRNVRGCFSGLTAIYATSEELARWVDKRNYARIEGFRQAQQQREQEEIKKLRLEDAGASSSSRMVKSDSASASASETTSYSFICECFFLTARALNLGPLKAISDYKHLMQDLARQKDSLKTLKSIQEAPGAPPTIERSIAEVEETIQQMTQERYGYEAQLLRDVNFLQEAIRFCGFMYKWLISLVGGVRIPLPAPCPMEFASLPEHFVEDAMELLLFSARLPKGLDGVVLDDFMSFILMFMSSPLYVKNPYLRAKMVEVLNTWMPSKHQYHPSIAASLAALFEGHHLALEHLVPDLLKLYVDIEFTGSHTQFYDKFNIRHNISELLEYLWEVQGHRNAWKNMAVEEEKGFYLRFLNLLVNDSIFLLDESLKKITELKEMEAERANIVEWESRTPQERQERQRVFHQTEQLIRTDLAMSNENVNMIKFTSSEITAPFLLPEMVERIAAMLNYFLLQLVITQRKALRIKDPEKYGFKPKELLSQIVEIYANLARGDSAGVFAKAISDDGRSYRDELFTEAEWVIRQIGSLSLKTVQDFVSLGKKAKQAAIETQDIEAMLGDIPDEFLDPIQCTLMTDPVILPSSKTTIDRATIQRHLLSDQTDPFNRSLLTPDMLIPDTELKSKIQDFLKSRKSS